MTHLEDRKLGAEAIEALFTRSDNSYLCARWGRGVSPVVFGVDDATLTVVKAAFGSVFALADVPFGDVDVELGSNLMVFFFRDWQELAETPNLDRLVPDLGPLVTRLQAAQANQYRFFRFDAAGGIKAAFVFVRMDAAMQSLTAETIALTQAVQTVVLWSDLAFGEAAPLALLPNGAALVKPEIAALIRAIYDPVLPVAATDPTHALRVAARIMVAQ